MLRVLFKGLCRGDRPNVMIARRQEQVIPPIRCQNMHDLLPLGIHRQVVAALNCVPNRDYESGIITIRFTPGFFVYARNRSACSIAKDYEVELIAGAGVSREPSRSDEDENDWNPHVERD